MAKQPRLVQLNCHRPIKWNESQVAREIAEHGHVLGENKEDGFRFHAFMLEGDVRVVTREGIEIRSLEHRRRHLRSLLETLPAGFVLDGEAVVLGVPFEDASGLLRRFEPIPEEYMVKFYVWDAMPFSAIKGIHPDDTPYQARKRFLLHKMQEIPYPSVYVEFVAARCLFSIEECHKFFTQTRVFGKEGAVIKSAMSGVRNGKVSGQWKLKPSDTADGRITGLVWGTPGLANEGKVIGFTVALEDGTECDATNISQAQMQEFTEAVIRHNGGPHVEFLRSYPGNNPFHNRYCHISYMEKTKTGSLRHPTFLNFRDLEYAKGFKV